MRYCGVVKDHKLYMKDEVSTHSAFVVAHSSYATYLKNIDATLSDFAHSSSTASTSAPKFDLFRPHLPVPNFPFLL